MARTLYGVSPWVDEVARSRRPDYPRWRGDESVPVIIVGGGLAGCFTAYAFAAAGVKAVLVEADRVGHVGAARSDGVLRGEAAPSYRSVESMHGRRAARALFEATRRAVLDLATTARRLGVTNVGVTPATRVLASYDGDEKAFAKEVALRRDAGLDAVWLKQIAARRESGAEQARAAVRLRDWGTASPYRLLTAFCDAATKRGARLFERSAVKRIRAGRKHVEVHLDGGVITADRVVVCTGEPTDLFRSLTRHLRLEERYVVVTERVPAAIRKRIAPQVAIVTDVDRPPHAVRWIDDGRLVVAGADQARPPLRLRDKTIRQRTGQLMYELTRLYPDVSGVMPTHGWNLPVGVTSDGVMYAGPHRNYPRHLFAWGTRHDPAHAFLASRILLRQYLGRAERGDEFFAFTRG